MPKQSRPFPPGTLRHDVHGGSVSEGGQPLRLSSHSGTNDLTTPAWILLLRVYTYSILNVLCNNIFSIREYISNVITGIVNYFLKLTAPRLLDILDQDIRFTT